MDVTLHTRRLVLRQPRPDDAPRIVKFLNNFAVSGKLAFEAKRNLPPDDVKLRASGYAELETFISRKVCNSPGRRAALEGWRDQAAAALNRVLGCGARRSAASNRLAAAE